MVLYNVNKSEVAKEKSIELNSKKNKVRKQGCCTSIFVQFCQRTDLHGYKYIVMEQLSIYERCFWCLAVIASIAIAINLVITAYNWYARNPIVTVIESTQGPIWNIPFPAITICSLNVISRRAARALVNNLTLPENMTSDETFESLRLMPLLHSMVPLGAKTKNELRKLQAVLDLNGIPIESALEKLSPARPCSRMIERCMWKNTVFRCDTLFEPVYTHFSLCCTFNYYAFDSQSKTKLNVQNPTSPRRVGSCGYQTALSVLLKIETDDVHSGLLASQGALVIVDNAYNIPNADSPVRMVNPTTEVLIAISPESTYTTPGVKEFEAEDRQCYYNNEIKLGRFRQYSYHNCIAYQNMDLVKNVCECKPYYYPWNDYHRTCNFNDIDCLEAITGSIKHNESQSCLPECEHFDYPLEVALGKLALNIKLNGLPLLEGVDLENRTIVNVFFNDLVSTRYRRDVYLNWQNLLASFGGLLSLMLGFTFIAGFDLFIFLVFGLFSQLEINRVEPSNQQVKPNKIHIQERNVRALEKKEHSSDKKWPVENHTNRYKY